MGTRHKWAPWHNEICKYCQSTSKVQAEIPQNIRVHGPLQSIRCAGKGLSLVLHGRRVRMMHGHTARVGTMAWSSHLLSSGSRDASILQRDPRAPEDFQHKLSGHRSEVGRTCFSLHFSCNPE